MAPLAHVLRIVHLVVLEVDRHVAARIAAGDQPVVIRLDAQPAVGPAREVDRQAARLTGAAGPAAAGGLIGAVRTQLEEAPVEVDRGASELALDADVAAGHLAAPRRGDLVDAGQRLPLALEAA